MEKGEQSVKKTTKRKKVLIILLVLVVIAVLQLVWSNGYIDVEKYEYRDAGVPKSFDGTKIVAVTDYHNHGGAYEDRLVKKIAEQSPDYIFYVGDIIDSYLTDVDKAESFFSKCADIAPGYLVYGNHELRVEKRKGGLERYNQIAADAGVTIVDNDIVPLERNGETMYLAGTRDTYSSGKIADAAENLDKTAPLLWIHHYPEDFEILADLTKENGFAKSLVFSGHAHGGLVQIPFTRIGLYAPGQGLLPEYTDGEYFANDCEMILSRGCGNSSITLRTFDTFELIVCELKTEH